MKKKKKVRRAQVILLHINDTKENLPQIYVYLHLKGNGQENFKCPDEFGFYPHHISCDKYWKCDNNVAELKTCGNGLAFDASDPKYLTENCDYIHNVDCGDRTQLGESSER